MEQLTVKEAFSRGFTCYSYPEEIRLGHTLRFYSLKRVMPTFEEGLEAWRRSRSVPLYDEVFVTVQTPEDIEILLDHVLL